MISRQNDRKNFSRTSRSTQHTMKHPKLRRSASFTRVATVRSWMDSMPVFSGLQVIGLDGKIKIRKKPSDECPWFHKMEGVGAWMMLTLSG